MKKIAVTGASHIHMPAFAKQLKERSDVTVTGVYDPDPAVAEKYAVELGCPVCVGPEEIWNDPAVDAVVVCSETVRHRELVLPAVAAGKHLFVEKPLGFRAEDAVEMAEAIERKGLIFQTGYFMRGTPAHQALKKMIDQGVFGTITRARHTNCHSGSLGGWFDGDYRWMADPSRSGCGGFGDLGTHSLDILMWFLGIPEQVTADVRTVTARYGENCDETGTALLKFRNGAVGMLAGAWVDVANPVTCEISGTQGFAYILNNQLFIKSVNLPGADGSAPWTDLPEALPHAFQLFLEAVTGHDVALIGAKEAAARSVVMEALYQAASRHCWVDIQL